MGPDRRLLASSAPTRPRPLLGSKSVQKRARQAAHQVQNALVNLTPPLRDLYVKAGISLAKAPRIYIDAQDHGHLKRTPRFQKPDLDPTEISFVKLTCTGLTTGANAVEAGEVFAGCTYLNSPGAVDQGPRLGEGSVLSIMARMVVAGARQVVAQEKGTLDQLFGHQHDPVRSLPHEVRFCLNPVRIEFVWRDRRDVYAPSGNGPTPQLERGLIERWATMPWAFSVAAGRAWLEIQRQHGTDPSLPLSDPSSARGGNENAETLPGASAHTRTKNRSRNGENRGPQHPHTMHALSLSQERASPSGGHPVPLSKGKDPPWPTTTNTTTI